MKAIQINKYGGPEVLEINQNAAEPEIKAGQVLVDVKAASINPFDNTIMAGYLAKMVPLKFPVTMGGDFSGVVAKVFPGETAFKVGDEIYGQAIILNGGSGSFAEKVASNVKNMALKPKNLNFVEAASLPLVGSSVIQTLEDSIKLITGQKILIHGGAGGIGSIAIQLAKHLGAYVTATASKNDMEFAKNLGADEVINYQEQSFEKVLKDYDAVYDTVGGETLDKSFLVLKKDGILASMKGQPNPELAAKYGITGIAINTKTDDLHLKRLTELVESGVVKSQVDKVFGLDQIKDAFIYKNTAHPKGKIVIQVI